MRDGKADWTPAALAANANVFLDDFLLFDVAKPITDTSHLEIEKSTLNGRAYETGGGRTVDANVIDILLTWMVNRDREFLAGRGDRGDEARHQDLSVLGSTEHGVAEAWPTASTLTATPDSGLGTDRRVRCELASVDCECRR